jgi:hypothetical protein
VDLEDPVGKSFAALLTILPAKIALKAPRITLLPPLITVISVNVSGFSADPIFTGAILFGIERVK